MTYRERREHRAERLREWSDKRAMKAVASFKAADSAVAGIPFGQPILVGHHSEARHRRDLDRCHSAMSHGLEHQAKSQSMAARADEIERQADHAIYSDDADAVDRLQEKIAGLEAQRDQIKTVNAAYRKAHRAELATMSAYGRDQAMPHRAYEGQNLSGNISRLRKRLELLSGSAGPNAPACVVPEAGTSTERAGLMIVAGMTTPSRAGKQPRHVWTVRGNLAAWRQTLIDLGGNWYGGAFSFWEDPTSAIETACAGTFATSEAQ